MKKILVILLLMAGATQLKAQQLQVMPNLSLNNGLQHYFKPDSLPKLLQPGSSLSSNKFNLGNSTNGGRIVYSTMPVVKLSSASMERMPVAVLRDNGVKYTMLVSKVTVVNPLQPADGQLP